MKYDEMDHFISYDELVGLCEQLGYRDKLRLAQILIQQARKEEENQNPQHRLGEHSESSEEEDDTIEYVMERLLKLRPSRKNALMNSIEAMFQFQGGISKAEMEEIVFELQRLKYIRISSNNQVTFLV
jgi:hypothetical protein